MDMINVLKGKTCAACVVAASLLAGCGALDPVNMILSARASSYDMVAEMTSPEMRNITLTSLRTADCSVLEGMIPIYQEDLRKGQAKADRVDIAVAEMNLSVVRQIQGEKSCPAAKPPTVAKNPASTSTGPAAAAASTAAANTNQGTLNISVDNVSPAIAKSQGMADQKGALVIETKKGSAADKAGIKPLDVIVEVNGQPVSTPAEFDQIVSRMRPGYKAPLRIARAGKTRNVTVVVSKDEHAASPASASVASAAPVTSIAITDPDTAPSMSTPLLAGHGWMGMQYGMSAVGVLENMPPAIAAALGLPRPQGVLIGGALPGAAADRAGLRTLDVVVSLNGRQIENKEQLSQLLGRLPAASTIKLGIWRNRKLEYAQVTLDPQVSQLLLPSAAPGYCFAWINANAAAKTGAVSYEFVVSAVDAAEDINPVIGAQFRAYLTERGIGAEFGNAPGYAVCRKSREAIINARNEATAATKQTLATTGKDTLAVYWIPR
ncbi:PDZ domain-containing protein [Herbaspirillum sp. NPDC101397]|uniref:PDZ domain-containing protein n=1 Tax=Herbaspirillum sp. NPDC101397 TaxID=3364006 RepID=UPI00383AD4CA